MTTGQIRCTAKLFVYVLVIFEPPGFLPLKNNNCHPLHIELLMVSFLLFHQNVCIICATWTRDDCAVKGT